LTESTLLAAFDVWGRCDLYNNSVREFWNTQLQDDLGQAR